ncbi:hypothetical protein [Pseudolysinimonas kribbensis]|nr:hypothetical protein [Pseudolysinimonas kribbensis]
MLGLIAGVTILLGMPVGRLRNLGPSVRLLLSAISVGVLLFLVWDVLTHAWEPIDAALADVQGASTIALDGAVFVVGLGAAWSGWPSRSGGCARLAEPTWSPDISRP